MQCSYENWVPHLPYLLVCFGFITGFDYFVASRGSSRWFKLHVLANLITCLTSYSDFYTLLHTPLIKPTLNSSLVPSNITLALHLYHMTVFTNLTTIDWVHHILMMGVLVMTYWCPNIAMTNYILFVVNGLPGGIDYLLLILVKDHVINRITEKKINSKLNVWIRGPSIVIGAYIIFLQWRYEIMKYSINLILLVIAALYWNAQYFTERVVYNWGHNSKDTTPTC